MSKHNPRIPRKKGQPAGSKKHSDLYTDENPKGTIKGLKFATVKDAKASVSKINNSGKKHAHKIQAAVAMEQRAKEMGKSSQAAVYRAYINKMKKITKKRQQEEIEEKCQKGYKTHPTRKTKKMFGKTYRNCVKAETIDKLNEKLSKSKIKKMRKDFEKTGKLPSHLVKLAKLMDKHTEIRNVVVPGLEWMADLDEGWSDKYKKSIDCNNPKGFSQKAHCAGKKKRQENVMNISKEKLKEMIREEYNNVLSENMMTEEQFDEQAGKKDACYHKVKARYDVWPSAYASGALVKCRKVGAANWGKSKKESIEEYDVENYQDYKEFVSYMKETYGTMKESQLEEAEYQGRKVKLGKPMQGDVKKFKVYVKNPKGNVVKVNFGHGGSSVKGKTMRIRKSNPDARKSFRARHNCDSPGPRHKARYWSCKKW
tara:strand:+ start:194 stop:1471 length:1278 start_codon:yes stop_codon:yes gene_type:complete